jgi:hypothetical protein
MHQEVIAWWGTHGISEIGRDPKLGSLRNVETCMFCNVFKAELGIEIMHYIV